MSQESRDNLPVADSSGCSNEQKKPNPDVGSSEEHDHLSCSQGVSWVVPETEHLQNKTVSSDTYGDEMTDINVQNSNMLTVSQDFVQTTEPGDQIGTLSVDESADHVQHLTQHDLTQSDSTQSGHVVIKSELQSQELLEEAPQADEDAETIFAYIDSDGNLRGRSSTGEDLVLQLQGQVPGEMSSEAILDGDGNVMLIQKCNPDSMLHTDGDVTYIVQQQSDDVEEETSIMNESETPDNELQVGIPADLNQDESPSGAANLVFFEDEACSLETAEFQVVGVEEETQGASIIPGDCQVICQDLPQQKRKRSPGKGEVSNGNKPKKPRKRKSVQKNASYASLPVSGESREKVAVQSLYNKSIEISMTENSSSQAQNAATVSETQKGSIPANEVSAEIPQPKQRRESKMDGAKPRRRSNKTPKPDSPSALHLQTQTRFEESNLTLTPNTATSVINLNRSVVGCEESSSDSIIHVATTSQQPYNCRLCTRFLSHSEDEVKTHIIKEHIDKACFVYRCDICSAFFITEPEITQHFQQKHPVARVDNISIVTSMKVILQTSPDNIKIFYEQKKFTSHINHPESASQPACSMSHSHLRTEIANLTPFQGELTAVPEYQRKTAISDNLPLGSVRGTPAFKSVAAGQNLGVHVGNPRTSTSYEIPQLPAFSTSYVCKVCKDFISPNQWMVRNHVLSDHIRNFPSVVHLCYACPFVGKSKDQINSHIINDHPGLPTNKVKVISDLEMLLILYASVTDISQKGKVFHWNKNTNNHEEVSQGSQTGTLTKYACSICEKFETHFEWHLRHHIAQEHTEGVGYLCDSCCIFSTMEKHEALLHSRQKHPNEQPNYKVLDWPVIFETVVRVTDSYFTAENDSSQASAPDIPIGPGAGQLQKASLSSSSRVIGKNKLPSMHSATLPQIHATFGTRTALGLGQIPPTVPKAGRTSVAMTTQLQPTTVKTPVLQPAIKSTQSVSLSSAQPMDNSAVISQSTLMHTSSVTSTSVITSAPSKRGQMSHSAKKIAHKPSAVAFADTFQVPVVSFLEPPKSVPAQLTQSTKPTPPSSQVCTPSGPQMQLGKDVHSFRCLVCHITTLSLPDIVKHIKESHVNATMYPYNCPQCGLPGCDYNIIRDHLDHKHKTSSYLPLINPGKVEFMKRYVNRLWIANLPPASTDVQLTSKTSRRRKRKTESQPNELNKQPAVAVPPLAVLSPPPPAIQPPLPPSPLQLVSTAINMPPTLVTTATVSASANSASVEQVPVLEAPKPKRRRRSKKQKAIQENSQIKPSGLEMPNQTPQPNSLMEIPFNTPHSAEGSQEEASQQNMKHPVPYPAPIPPSPQSHAGNKKGRNLDKGIRYYCKLCSYSTHQLVYADSHSKCAHLKIKPFCCPYCSFAAALEHKAKMHVVFKHKDQLLKIEVDEEAVALLEIEARKLYEARRTDNNEVVDLAKNTTSPRKSSEDGPQMSDPMPTLHLQPPPEPSGTEVVIPISVTEEVTQEGSDAQAEPPIASVQVTEQPNDSEITDKLQIVVESPVSYDVLLSTSLQAVTTPAKETNSKSEEPASVDLSLSVQTSQPASSKSLSLPTPETTEQFEQTVASHGLVTEHAEVETFSDTPVQSTEPVVQQAVTEVAETMASMCSQVVIHQPKESSADEAGEVWEAKESSDAQNSECDSSTQTTIPVIKQPDQDEESTEKVTTESNVNTESITYAVTCTVMEHDSQSNLHDENSTLGAANSHMQKNQSIFQTISSVRADSEITQTESQEIVHNQQVLSSEEASQQVCGADAPDDGVVSSAADSQCKLSSSQVISDAGEISSLKLIEEVIITSNYVNCDSTAESRSDISIPLMSACTNSTTVLTATSEPVQNDSENTISNEVLNNKDLENYFFTAVTPKMVGDLAIDVAQETVADGMKSISAESANSKETNICKTEFVDKRHDADTLGHIVAQCTFSNKSKLTIPHNKSLQQEIFSSCGSSGELLSVKSDLYKSVLKRNGNHLPKDSFTCRPMPLSVKLARYSAPRLNSCQPTPLQKSVSSHDNSLSITKRCFYCKHCCRSVDAEKEIETRIICKHVTVNPYFCSDCDYSTSQYSRILKHMESVHGKETHISESPSIGAQMHSETDKSFSFIYTATEGCSDSKLFLKPVVLLPNIFEVLTENGGL